MIDKELQDTILELMDEQQLRDTGDKEAVGAAIILAARLFRAGDDQKAEQILRDGLYEIEFNSYMRELKVYKRLNELANRNPSARKIFEETGYLESCYKTTLKYREYLNNFNQRIFSWIQNVRRSAAYLEGK